MTQEIFWGTGQLPQLLQGKKWLLVHGNSFRHSPLYPIFTEISHTSFTNFTPNPLYEQVQQGVQLFQRSSCTAIAAIGGGSAIDVAKCIKLYSRMDPNSDFFQQPAEDTKIPLLALPTTAGTGSESTRHAVIYRNGKKCSITHDSILPDVAVLEPSVLHTLPLSQKKSTMLDALCQAIESWWSIHATPESQGLSKTAIELIRDNWKPYIKVGDPQAAEQIMRAANLSGQAINLTATTAPHAMSYRLTSLYGIPHGHAVALCMAGVWPYTRTHLNDCQDSRGTHYLQTTLKEIESVISPEWFSSLLDQLEMKYPFSQNRMMDISQLTESVNPERLSNHPVKLPKEILTMIYEGIVRS